MSWGQLIAEGIKSTIGTVAGIASAAASREEENARIRREKSRITSAIGTLDEMLKNGEIDLNGFMSRLDSFTSQSSKMIKDSVAASLEKGISAINKQYEATLGDLKKNIEFIKQDADITERKELDRLGKQIDSLSQGLKTTQQEARTSTVQRRLTGASALSILNKQQKTYNDAVNQAHETSGKIRSDIRFGLQRAIDQGNQQIASLGLRTGAQVAQLEGAAGEKEAAQLLNLEQNKFNMAEGKIDQFNKMRQDILSEKGQLGAAGAGLEERGLSAAEIFSAALTGHATSGANFGPAIDSIYQQRANEGAVGGDKTTQFPTQFMAPTKTPGMLDLNIQDTMSIYKK